MTLREFRGAAARKTLARWMRFNAVGAMGMVVQLSSLALLNRAWHGHYLYATAAALELTLLHNFVWHLRFTWRDRGGLRQRGRASPWRQLLRFHLSNGLVSLLGNLGLTRLLVQQAHLPLLVANLAAIVACSMANFGLGEMWVFAGHLPAQGRTEGA